MNSDKIVSFALLLMIIVIVPAIYLYNEYECKKEVEVAVADAVDETVKDLSDAIMNKEDFGEVFHISDNVYTYQQAEGVCKKYGAKLATRKQIKDAQAKGANWCSYGWSAGGEAYYPIQKEFLDNLPADKKGMCGKVGVNGGVFDIASGNNYSILTIVSEISKLIGLKPEIEFIDRPIGDQERTLGSLVGAKEYLNYLPSVSLTQGLKNQIDFYVRKNIE